MTQNKSAFSVFEVVVMVPLYSITSTETRLSIGVPRNRDVHPNPPPMDDPANPTRFARTWGEVNTMVLPNPRYDVTNDTVAPVSKQTRAGMERGVLESIHVNDQSTIIATLAIGAV